MLTLQRAAYVSESQLYGNIHLPPLTESLDDVRAALRSQFCLVAFEDHRTVGSARLHTDGADGHISRLIVATDRQNRGLGTQLMASIEEAADPIIDRFELFTGHRSKRNLALYERLGYREFERRPAGDHVVLIYLEKNRRAT